MLKVKRTVNWFYFEHTRLGKGDLRFNLGQDPFITDIQLIDKTRRALLTNSGGRIQAVSHFNDLQRALTAP